MKIQIKGNLARLSINRKCLVTCHHIENEDDRAIHRWIKNSLDLNRVMPVLSVLINGAYQRISILARMTKYEDPDKR